MRGGLLAAIVWAGLVVATPARAQVAGGLFGATRSDGDPRDKLNIHMSLAEAFDSHVPEGAPAALPDGNGRGGGFSTILSASADYARRYDDVDLFGSASSYVRNNDLVNRFATGPQRGQLGATFRLPKQSAFTASQSVAYSVSYLDQVFPGDAAPAPDEGLPVNPEFQVTETESYSYETRLTLTNGRQIGTRLVTSAEYGFSDVQRQTNARPDVTTYGVGTRLHYTPTRRGGFSLGYQYRTGEFGSQGMTVGHEMPVGVEYSPALSVSRRLTLRLEVTPTLLDVPASALTPVQGDDAVDHRLYPVQFDASVDYPFKLRWRASAGVGRRVRYLSGLSEPTLSNTARLRVMGVIGRRVDVSVLARYATSESTISSGATDLATYTGEARFRFAVSRSFAFYSEYVYYYYDDEIGRPALVPGLPEAYEQHGIRVGVTLFAQPF